ncbi:MAG: hypothetical protein IT182_04920 [Acidobacteria bacterium]|nr:hypothetical protein [Acidobacteriota bacterium]
MNDPLQSALGEWKAPRLPDARHAVIDRLFDGDAVALVAPARRPLAHASFWLHAALVALLLAAFVVWRAPASPALISHVVVESQTPVRVPGARPGAVAATVSAVDLDGFEVMADPRIRVTRRTP